MAAKYHVLILKKRFKPYPETQSQRLLEMVCFESHPPKTT